MKIVLSTGSRVALSLALVCGLAPQAAFAQPADDGVDDQAHSALVGELAHDSTDSSITEDDESTAGTFDESSTEDVVAVGGTVASGSESDEAGEDPSDSQEAEAIESVDGKQVEATTMPSEETMQEAMGALDAFVSASSGISLMSSSSNGVARESSVVEEYSGADRFEVACKVAEAAYPDGAKQAIIAGSEGWADALSATSLAGVLDCPILLTEQGSLNAGTKATLKELGVESVIIVGGPNTVSTDVESQLKSSGFSVAKRLGGADRYEVQMNIYNYAKGKWNDSLIIVASGAKFSDALSSSPLAFSQKAPIFLVDDSGNLNSAQKSALGAIAYSGGAERSVIVGGTASVSTLTESFLDGVTLVGSDGAESATRLGGADRYEASANFAKWAVKQGYLSWEGSAFTTGERPYDALSGSVLQGKDTAVMLLINGTGSPTVSAFISGNAGSVKFFGGTDSVPSSWRASIMEQMGLVDAYDAGMAVDVMTDIQTRVNGASWSDLKEALDPMSYAYGESGFYQFANVYQGYGGKVTASQINAFLESVCSVNGYSDSTLLGQGAAIVSAAKKYNVNEVYLLSHAILESGWGMSALSQGTVKGYEGYYNFYGIGAWDRDPNNGGAYLAKSQGWDTPAKALEGAAKWISDNYLSQGQNTLYKMRWNVASGVASHQYATAPDWAANIARVMNQVYEYFGYGPADTGLTFLYPVYR